MNCRCPKEYQSHWKIHTNTTHHPYYNTRTKNTALCIRNTKISYSSHHKTISHMNTKYQKKKPTKFTRSMNHPKSILILIPDRILCFLFNCQACIKNISMRRVGHYPKKHRELKWNVSTLKRTMQASSLTKREVRNKRSLISTSILCPLDSRHFKSTDKLSWM